MNAYGGDKKNSNSRRTWDTAVYEQKAREREQQIKDEEEDEERRRKGLKPRARPGTTASAKTKGLLQARKQTVNLEGMVGKVQVVQASSAASGQPGFYCSVCDVTVKDSLTYLDHINGKNHQRMLNRGMKVASETVDDVLAKLESLREARRRRDEQKNAIYDFDEQVRRQEMLQAERRRRRKEAKKRQKSSKADTDGNYAKDGDGDGDNDNDDDDDGMIAMMGFGNFGSTKNA
ncbi:U4/U6.U5 snRNP associated protein [Coemansia interrupta]|uniref:U4/U6.U5 snRNP associated protein n=1 Tax=Coemansia interrupta TaxID=1126814 RepID=A0A9W8LLJ5_9FUNG|nr:U4/U6.U5 snRNP associated protein [Coemansia interrupta]